MSATGRADAIEARAPSLPGMRHGREREKDDFYATPAWCTRAILRRLAVPSHVHGERMAILDPCCGDGAILSVAADQGLAAYGIEIDEARAARALERVDAARKLGAPEPMISGQDALDGRHWMLRSHMIVTNPPYKDAMRFVERAIAPPRHRGEVGAQAIAMLLRLGFMASAGRAAFHRAHPADVYVLPKRPSFTGDGTTEYAWFVWSAAGGGRWEVLTID